MKESGMERGEDFMEMAGTADAAKPWIRVEHVSFEYDEGLKSLDDVSLELFPGKNYALIGPNGCGKSTLLRILTGLSFPTAGTYEFQGKPVTEKGLRQKKEARAFYGKVGFLFQNSETQLFCTSVEDEIAFGLLQAGLEEREVRERTERYLALLKLNELRKRAPFHLSGGEQKRTALAAVLAMEPSVLILDEPEAGLDEDGEEWITDFLNKLRSPERLILIASHSRDLVRSAADEEIRINKYHRIVTS